MTPPPPWARDAKGTITTAPVFEARQDMTDDPVQHRIYHHTPADSVELRESDEDGVFGVRMPIVTTGEVRNQGDEPFTREELDGFRQQVAEGGLGVFLDHGMSAVGGNRYSATGKIGEWVDPEISQRDADGEAQLVATARLMDPETLPEAAGDVREALTVIKEQAERGMSLAASIGWRTDEDAPGGNDAMETSIVGIPADPRTTSDHTPAATAARALTADGREEFEERLEELRAVVMEPTDDEAGNGRDSVTDEPGEPGEDPDNDRGEQDGMDAEEHREFMREQQRQQTETLSALADALREDDEDDGEEDDDEDEEDDDRGADGDDEERALDVDGEEVTAEDVREMREQLGDAEPEDPEERDADGDEEEEQDDERAADPKELLS